MPLNTNQQPKYLSASYLLTNHIYIKKDLALNNPQGLIGH